MVRADKTDSPFVAVLDETFTNLKFPGSKYLREFLNWSMCYNPKEKSIIVASDHKAAELFHSYGPNFEEAVLSLESSALSEMLFFAFCCDLTLAHCTPDVKKLELYLWNPVVNLIVRIESLLETFWPALTELRIRKETSDSSNRDLKEELNEVYNYGISLCTNLEVLYVGCMEKASFEADLRFLELTGKNLRDLEFDIILTEDDDYYPASLEYIRTSCPKLEVVFLTEKWVQSPNYLDFLGKYG